MLLDTAVFQAACTYHVSQYHYYKSIKGPVMQTEYEAMFPAIEKERIRQRLQTCGALLCKLEFLQIRCVFDLPEGQEIPGGWLRLRHEGDRIMLALKIITGRSIEEQRELELQVSDFQQAEELLCLLGCRKRAYQENKRELWKLNGVDITIDTWPFLPPFVEVEGSSEQVVREICALLDLPYEEAIFGSIDTLYARHYHISPDVINHEIPVLTFGGVNPLLRFSPAWKASL